MIVIVFIGVTCTSELANQDVKHPLRNTTPYPSRAEVRKGLTKLDVHAAAKFLSCDHLAEFNCIFQQKYLTVQQPSATEKMPSDHGIYFLPLKRISVKLKLLDQFNVY